MRRENEKYLKAPLEMIIAALVLLFLQGCTTPLVSVKVSSGSGCPKDENGLGLCNAGVPWGGGSAAGFYQDTSGPTLPQGTPITCKSGSKKCNGTPGDCYGMNCITRIKNIASNKGDCYCGCPF